MADGSVTGPLNCFTGRTRASLENVLVSAVVFWLHIQLVKPLSSTQQVVTEELLNGPSETSGRADFSSGLMQAFEALNDSSECYKIIMVITDKDADHEELNDSIEHQNLLPQVIYTCLCVHMRSPR